MEKNWGLELDCNINEDRKDDEKTTRNLVLLFKNVTTKNLIKVVPKLLNTERFIGLIIIFAKKLEMTGYSSNTKAGAKHKTIVL